MTTKTITTSADGSTTVVESDEDGPPTPPSPPHKSHLGANDGFNVGIHSNRPFDGGSFTFGLMVGLLLYYVLQTWARRRRHRPAKLDRPDVTEAASDQARMAADVAALARRTATLETIVTDPAQRTAREIEALR